jgi:hypothetical protein
MFQRLVELVLCLGLVIGLCFLYQSATVRHQHSQEYQRLTRKAGSLTDCRRDKVTLQAVETGESLHFAWRIFVPHEYDYGYRSKVEVRGKVSSSRDQDFVFRYRFYEQRGKWYVYVMGYGGEDGHAYEVKSQELIEFLTNAQGRDQLQVEQLGTAGTVEVDFGKTISLLKIRRPPGIGGPVGEADPYLDWLCFGPPSLYDDTNRTLPSE